MLKADNNQAFTLIELLISMAIFAVMATAAYSGLGQILLVKDSYKNHGTFLDQIQKTYLQIHKDYLYLSNASNRDQYGQTISSFKHNDEASHLFSISSANKPNPLQLKQHPFIKIDYYLEDEQLIRAFNSHFNSAPNSKIKRRILLNNVQQVQVRFMDKSKQWQAQWPPLNLNIANTQTVSSLPIATEVSLYTQNHGKFVWLFTQ